MALVATATSQCPLELLIHCNITCRWDEKKDFYKPRYLLSFITICRSTIIFRCVPFSAIPSLLRILITYFTSWNIYIGMPLRLMLLIEILQLYNAGISGKCRRSINPIDAIADVLNANGIFFSLWL